MPWLAFCCPSVKYNIGVTNTTQNPFSSLLFFLFFPAKIFTFLDCLAGRELCDSDSVLNDGHQILFSSFNAANYFFPYFLHFQPALHLSLQ